MLNHQYWWTLLPAWPAGPDTWQARAIKRVFYDHTMSKGRSVYSERRADGRPREDVLAAVMFNLFMAYDDLTWAEELLKLCHVPFASPLRDVRFSWLYEEEVAHVSRGFVIADVVLCWRDASHGGLLIFEAKTLRESVSAKDFPTAAHYLRMPSIRGTANSHYRLLLDDGPATQCVEAGIPCDAIIRWSELRGLQKKIVSEPLFAEAIDIQHKYWLDGASQPALVRGLPSATEAFETMNNSDRFLFGFDAVQKRRLGLESATHLPYWIRAELSEDEIRLRKSQSTRDRRIPNWSLPP